MNYDENHHIKNMQSLNYYSRIFDERQRELLLRFCSIEDNDDEKCMIWRRVTVRSFISKPTKIDILCPLYIKNPQYIRFQSYISEYNCDEFESQFIYILHIIQIHGIMKLSRRIEILRSNGFFSFDDVFESWHRLINDISHGITPEEQHELDAVKEYNHNLETDIHNLRDFIYYNMHTVENKKLFPICWFERYNELYKIIYDCAINLPKDLVKIIQEYVTEYELQSSSSL
jgi:hypothetical protein